jgi:hypothetical protein
MRKLLSTSFYTGLKLEFVVPLPPLEAPKGAGVAARLSVQTLGGAILTASEPHDIGHDHTPEDLRESFAIDGAKTLIDALRYGQHFLSPAHHHSKFRSFRDLNCSALAVRSAQLIPSSDVNLMYRQLPGKTGAGRLLRRQRSLGTQWFAAQDGDGMTKRVFISAIEYGYMLGDPQS